MLSDLGQPAWIVGGASPVYGVLHHYHGQDPARTAVLIVPPFGWDDMSSYRARRSWATALARGGFPTLRIDLPGTGESGGYPTDRGLADSWVEAVSLAADQLRSATGVHRVAAIGIGTGGLVAWRAMCAGAAIEDLILWSVRPRGRLAVRELSAQSAIIAGRLAEEPPDQPVADASMLTGFLMSRETRDWLSAVTLGDQSLPDRGERRALVLGRDAHGVDEDVVSALRDAGMTTSSVESEDYQKLMEHPSNGFAPNATTAAVQRWLGADGGLSGAPAQTPTIDAQLITTATISTPTVPVTETVIGVPIDGVLCVAVLSEPADASPSPVTAVILNSGFQRRCGPNRSSVELARRWAASGVTTLRIDFAGIGDTDGDESELAKPGALYQPRFVPETIALLEYLRESGIGERFVVVGHCSGAYWGLHAAAHDPSVIGVFALDPTTLAWSDGLHQERMREKIVETIRGGTLRRIRERGLTRGEVGQVGRVLVHQVRIARRVPEEVRMARSGASILELLRDRGTEVVIVMVRDSPIPAQLSAAELDPHDGSWSSLHLVDLPSGDHLMRATPIQRMVAAELDAALETVLHRHGHRQLTAPAR